MVSVLGSLLDGIADVLPHDDHFTHFNTILHRHHESTNSFHIVDNGSTKNFHNHRIHSTSFALTNNKPPYMYMIKDSRGLYVDERQDSPHYGARYIRRVQKPPADKLPPQTTNEKEKFYGSGSPPGTPGGGVPGAVGSADPEGTSVTDKKTAKQNFFSRVLNKNAKPKPPRAPGSARSISDNFYQPQANEGKHHFFLPDGPLDIYGQVADPYGPFSFTPYKRPSGYIDPALESVAKFGLGKNGKAGREGAKIEEFGDDLEGPMNDEVPLPASERSAENAKTMDQDDNGDIPDEGDDPARTRMDKAFNYESTEEPPMHVGKKKNKNICTRENRCDID